MVLSPWVSRVVQHTWIKYEDLSPRWQDPSPFDIKNLNSCDHNYIGDAINRASPVFGIFLAELCQSISIDRPQMMPSRRLIKRSRNERTLAQIWQLFGGTLKRVGDGPLHFATAAPQVRPAPNPTNTILSPGFKRPCLYASQVAIGIDAVEVLP